MGKSRFNMENKNIQEEIIGVGTENLDYVIDFLTEDDSMKDVPLVGQVVRVIKLGHSFKDYMLTVKLKRFVETVKEKSTEKERRSFSEKIKNNQRLREHLYSSIFMKIDNYDDISKPDIFAKIYSCLITNRIQWQEYEELSFALGASSLTDLINLTQHYWGGDTRVDRYIMGARSVVITSRPKKWQDVVNCSSLCSAGLMEHTLKELKEIKTRDLLDNEKVRYEMNYELTLPGKLYVHISNDMEDKFKIKPFDPYSKRESGWQQCGDYSFQVKDKNKAS